MLQRLKRKIREIWRFPALAWRIEDLWELWILGVFHSRVITHSFAKYLTCGRSGIIHPRLKNTHGESIRIDLGDPSQIDTFIELFLDRVYDLSRVPFRPDLVVDCGAHCGYFSAMATGVFPGAAIFAFEANPANKHLLGEQFALLRRQPKLAMAAVSDRDGEAEFSGSGVGGSIISHGDEPRRYVPCINFAAWLRTQAPSRFVLKLDIEGAEKLVLGPCLHVLPNKSVVFLETHYPDFVCKEMLDPYRAAGFGITEIRRRKAADRDFCYVEWVLLRDD